MSQNQSTATNVDDFIGELNSGILKDQLAAILSETALATVLHGKGNKKGKVNIELTFAQIGENEQVVVSAKLSKSAPTARGKKYEENITDTSMFVGKGGRLTIDQPKEDNNGQFALNQQSEGVSMSSKEGATVRRIGDKL